MKQTFVTILNGVIGVSIVTQEEVSAPATPFAAKEIGETKALTYDGTNFMSNISDMMGRNAMISEQSINEIIKEIVDGIPAAKAKAIENAILASYKVIDESIITDFTPSEDDKAEVKKVYDDMIEQMEKMKEEVTSGASNALSKYVFKKHVLLQGEKGGGKTYMVSKMLRDMKDINSIDIRGNEGLEAWMFLGNYIPTESGKLVWVDGPLAQAFRSAASGTKTVLFIDEMLRIPKRELNVLVGALSPDDDGNFSLDIDRASTISVDENGDAIGNRETIRCKTDMLWCVGTTNAGAGYAVDSIDEALGDRFRTVIKRTGDKEMKAILESTAKVYGHDKKYVTKLMNMYKSYNKLKESGELTKLVNLRHLCEILEFTEKGESMVDAATDLIPTWCSQDQHGYPNDTQESIIEGIIEKELV